MAEKEFAKPQRDELTFHIDACAMQKGAAMECLVALDDVYEATGFRKLHYLETEQGLREKLDLTNLMMWNTLKPDTDKLYSLYMHMNDGDGKLRLETTDFCDKFSNRFMTLLFDKYSRPRLEQLERLTKEVKNEVYKIYKQYDPDYLKEHDISQPSEITLSLSEADPDLIISRGNKGHINAQEVAIQIVKKKIKLTDYWEHSDNNMTGITRLLGEYRNLGAIAAQLGFLLEPYHMNTWMREHGYPEGSPLDTIDFDGDTLSDGDKRDPMVMKRFSGAFPDMSVLEPPLSDLPNKRTYDAIVMQSMKYTKLWPFGYRNSLSKEDSTEIRNTSRDCADNAIVQFINDELPKMSPELRDRSAFFVITQDGPMIEKIAQFTSGKKSISQNGTEERKVVDLEKDDYLLPMHSELKSKGRINPKKRDEVIRLKQTDPAKMPPVYAVTLNGFLNTMRHESKLLHERYDGVENGDIKQSLQSFDKAIRGLNMTLGSASKPGVGITQRKYFERVETPFLDPQASLSQ